MAVQIKPSLNNPGSHFRIGPWEVTVRTGSSASPQPPFYEVSLSREGEKHVFYLESKRLGARAFSIREHIDTGTNSARPTVWASGELQSGSCEVFIQDPQLTRTIQVNMNMSATTSGSTRTGTSENLLKAPMPGRVVAMHAKPGARFKPGEAIVVIEAMKMQNELSAKIACRVKKVHVKEGDNVERNALLVEFE